MLGITLITGGDITRILSAYAVGHLYIFITVILPEQGTRKNYLETPNWFKKIVDWVAVNVANVNLRPARQNMANNVRDPQNNNNFRAFRGAGMRIGGD